MLVKQKEAKKINYFDDGFVRFCNNKWFPFHTLDDHCPEISKDPEALTHPYRFHSSALPKMTGSV